MRGIARVGRLVAHPEVRLALAVFVPLVLLYQLAVPLRATHAARVNVDEPFYLLTTVSLLMDGDLDLANDYALRRYRAFFDHPQELWTQSAPTADGRLLSPHGVGLSVLVLPTYALDGVDGVKRWLTVLAAAAFALAAVLAGRLAGRPWPAALAALAVGAGAPAFVYSAQVYPEMPAALVVTVCLLVVLSVRWSATRAAALAVGVTALLWLGAKYAPLGAVLAAAGLWRGGWTARAALGGLLAASGAAYTWFHVATYGGLTPYAVNALYAGSDDLSLVAQHAAFGDRLYRLAGLWVDREFGLVRWAPVLALVLPGLWLLPLRRMPAAALLAAIAVQVTVAAFFSITMRGWWFPGRMLVAVLPLLAVPLACLLAAQSRRARIGVLAAGTGALTLATTLALWHAAAGQQVVLAVDPFDLAWPVFQAVAPAFPLYTSYEPMTWLLTGAWALAAVGLCVAGAGLAAGPGPSPGQHTLAPAPSRA